MGTPVTYNEAATILGLPYYRIKLAVSRDVLTQVPGGRSGKQVYKEQVELFKGKAELSKNLLSPAEYKTWEEIAALASAPAPVSIPAQAPAPVPQSTPVYLTDSAGIALMSERGIALEARPTNAGGMIFQPTPADRADIEISLPASPLVSLILLGLLVLCFVDDLKKKRTGAARQAEQAIKRLGFEKEDLLTSQREEIGRALQNNPAIARNLQALLSQEGLLPAA